MKNKIDSILYKMYRVKNDDRLILVYNYYSDSSQSISPSGRKRKNSNTILGIVDITSSIREKRVIIDTFHLLDIDEFIDSIEETSISENEDKVIFITSILLNEMNMLSQKTNEISQAMMSLNFLNKREHTDKGGVVIANEQSQIINIVYKTINGSMAKLKKEEIIKIGGILSEIMTDHSAMDTDNQDEIKKLTAEIEYKLIEALPNHVKAEDVSINTAVIVDEIRNNQKEKGKDD